MSIFPSACVRTVSHQTESYVHRRHPCHHVTQQRYCVLNGKCLLIEDNHMRSTRLMTSNSDLLSHRMSISVLFSFYALGQDFFSSLSLHIHSAQVFVKLCRQKSIRSIRFSSIIIESSLPLGTLFNLKVFTPFFCVCVFSCARICQCFDYGPLNLGFRGGQQFGTFIIDYYRKIVRKYEEKPDGFKIAQMSHCHCNRNQSIS